MVARSLYLALIIITLFSCEESVDGCLDIRASNFDVTAVTACDSCCTFPTGSLSLDFRFDTLDLSFNTDYPLGEDTIQLRSIRLPFSQFKLIRLGEELNLIDSVLRFSPYLRDDYVVIELETAQTIGHTDYVTLIDHIEARVGIDTDEVNQLQPFIDISGGNNVNQLISKMYNDSLMRFAQVIMEVEIEDSIRDLEILSIENPIISLNDTIDILQGRNWTIDWELDVKRMLDGINPTMSNEAIADVIGQNLSGAVQKK